MKNNNSNNNETQFFFFLIIIVWLGLCSAISYAQEIEHEPPRDFINTDPIILRLKIFDLADYEVKCFYKFNDAEEFSIIELDKIGRRIFRAEIFPQENANNIKYYFWIYKNNQFYKTLPENNPVGIPFSVLNTQEDLDYFTLLSPLITEEKMGYKKEMMFILRNNFPNAVSFDSAVLNDDEPLKIIRKKKVLLNIKSTFPIRQGKNRLLIKGTLSDGTIIKQNFEFKTKKLKKKRAIKKTNEVKLSHNYFKTDKSDYTQNDFEMLYSIKQNIETNSLLLETYGLYDNRGSDYTQPYSRVRLNVIDKGFRWKIKSGDIQENFSPLTVNGRRIRGLYADINLLKFFNKQSTLSLNYLFGNSNDAIEISSPNVTIPTYKQEVKGYQIKFSSMKFKSSLQYFKIYDDPHSLNNESKEVIDPIENHIIGTFIQLRPTPLSYIENEFVLAAYYANSQASTISTDELGLSQPIKDLIEKYLPIKSSLSGGFTNRFTFQTPLLSKKNIVKFGYDYVHPNYQNILNTFVEPDKEEISLTLTQRLLNRKLIINTHVENERDNVLKTSVDTSNTNTYRFNAIYRTKMIGSFNATGMLTRKTEVVTTSNEDIDNQLNYVMVGISGIPLSSKIGKINANINYSISDYLDYIMGDNSSYSNSFGASLYASYKKYRTSLGLIQSKTTSTLSGTSRYLSLYSRASRKITKQLKVSTKIKLTLGINNDDNNQMDSRKVTNNWMITYNKEKLTYFKSSQLQLGVDFIYMKDDDKPSEETSNFKEAYASFSITNKF
ncbi:hypothetical protein DID74_00520 [Candidatus Marinamargulisbacteria bacterium SCGC AG-333-B06]|nr:hypothetical protein DID74_00520 [Candidatus Marinamargulisbacteria bacterium SCGC AG-333-B06]